MLPATLSISESGKTINSTAKAATLTKTLISSTEASTTETLMSWDEGGNLARVSSKTT